MSEGHPEFLKILKEIGDLHKKKGADYGVVNDIFLNIRQSMDWGVEPWVGAMVRAGDNTNLDLKQIPRLGSIAVFVAPEEAKNAEIYIDGELKGNAPKLITLTMGNHDVEIKQKDYLLVT